MSRVKDTILKYCDATGTSRTDPSKWPPLSEMSRAIFFGDRAGWTDEQMEEVDDVERNRKGR